MAQRTDAMKEALKDLIRQINDGMNPETIQNQFAELVKETIPDVTGGSLPWLHEMVKRCLRYGRYVISPGPGIGVSPLSNLFCA